MTDSTEVTAINRLSELSHTIISIIMQDIRETKQGQRTTQDYIRELSDTNQMLSKLVAKLNAQADQLEKHFAENKSNDLLIDLITQLIDELRLSETVEAAHFITPSAPQLAAPPPSAPLIRRRESSHARQQRK